MREVDAAAKTLASGLVEADDIAIIESVIGGKRDDFELLLKRYGASVLNIVSNHLPQEEVEDAAQEVFIRIYKSLASYRAEAPFSHWISKIAVRYCYDSWRERYRSEEVHGAILNEEHNKWIEGVLSQQSQEVFQRQESVKESLEVVQWALNKLSAMERMLLTLLYFEGFSVKEAADLLGLSVVNVKVRAFRLRSKLRKILTPLVKCKGG